MNFAPRPPLALTIVSPSDELARGAADALAPRFETRTHRFQSCRQLRRDGLPAGGLLVCEPRQSDCAAFVEGACWAAREGEVRVISCQESGDEADAPALIRGGVRDVLSPRDLGRLAAVAEREAIEMGAEQAGRLEALLEFAPDPVLVLDTGGRLLRANRLAEQLLGYSEAELAGQAVEMLLPAARRERHAERRAVYSASPSPRPMGMGMQFPALHKDGTEIPVEISLAPMAVGGRGLICCGLRDLRERVRAGRLLRAILEGTASHTGEAFLRSLLRNLTHALGVATAFVAELVDDRRATMLRVRADGMAAEPFEFVLADTPAGGIADEEEFLVHEGARERFPRDALLQRTGAQSYFAVRLSAREGEPLGLLGIADARPLADEATARTVLRIFGARAAAELERLRASRALAESTAQLRIVADHVPAMIAYSDAGHRYAFVNDAFNAFYLGTGRSAEGRTVAETLGEELWREVRPNLERALAGEELWYLAKRRDAAGRERALNVALIPHRGLAGRVRGVFTFIRDVSEQRQAEMALRAASERLSKIYRNSPAAIGLLRLADGAILDVNEAYERLFGWRREEVVGLSTDELLIWADPNDRARFLAQIAAAGRVSGFGSKARRKDGRLFDSLTYSEVIDESGVRLLLVMVLDVTDQQQAEAEIRALNENLERRVAERTQQLSEANQELAAFSYSVSHDLRAPLRAMAGFARLLADDFGGTLPPKARHYLERISAGSAKMGRLIDGLLDFARLGRVELGSARVHPARLVEEVLADHAAEIQRRGVEVRIGPLPECTGDALLLRQVWANLIGNALKYTAPRERAVVEVGALQSEGESAYYVRDNGAGFDPQYADKLFGVFQRLHTPAEFEGEGIGLATVRRIVGRHGGRVWAEGAPDRGATFYFSLGPSSTVATATRPPSS